MQLLSYVVSLSVVVSAITVRDLRKRQALPQIVPSDCEPACETFAAQSNSCEGDLTCLCTDELDNNFKVCGDCIVTFNSTELSDIQSAADGYVSACRQVGFNIPTITISALGSSSSGGSNSLPPNTSSPSGTSSASESSSTESSTSSSSPSPSASSNGNSGDDNGTGSSSSTGNSTSDGTGDGSGNSTGTGGSSGSNSSSGSGSGSSGNNKSAAYGSSEHLLGQALFIFFLTISATFVLLG